MATIIRPEHDACFQCAWRQLHHWKRELASLTERPKVDCQTQGTRNYCNGCTRAHDPCEKVAEMLEGDCRDMFALLEWCDRILGQRIMVQEGEASVSRKLWTDDQKEQLQSAGIRLFSAFKDMEKEHRVQHGLHVGKQKRTQTGATARYDLLVATRRGVLERGHPDPVAHANERLLRLRLGDQNCMTWAKAKINFVDKVLDRLLARDAQIAHQYRQSLPAGVIIWT